MANGGAFDPELHELEARLLQYTSVRDCVALRRAGLDGTSTIVAYVVATGRLTLDALQQHARAAGASAIPGKLVRISSVPLLANGRVHTEALAAIPVIDERVIQELQNAVRQSGSSTDSEVLVDWVLPPEEPLRVDDLIATRTRSTPSPASAALRGTAGDDSGVPSLSVGAEVTWDVFGATRLGALLVNAAERLPEHTVTCIEHDGEHVLNYRQLLERADRVMAGLRAAGMKAGDIALFQFERNPDFIAAFWGCMLGGFVPAPLAVPAAGDANNAAALKLKNAWSLLGRPVVLTSSDLEPVLSRLGDSLGLDGFRVLSVGQLEQAAAGQTRAEPDIDDVALLLLTSGSTGVPKAVTQTHRALLCHIAGARQRHGFTSDDVPLNWLPLDHVGAIVMHHLRDVALGCNAVQVRTDYVLQDALRWLDLIDRFKASITWAPNFVFALINDRTDELATRRWDLSSMRFLLNGGEAIVSATARRFMKRLTRHGLPETAMRPAWGMSETCAAATHAPPFSLDETSDDDEFVDVGGPNPGFSMRIVDDEQRLVPEGREGNLEVRGGCVTHGYLNNPQVNSEAFTADGWFRTGDLGRLTSGRLTITGRAKGEIIANGVNYNAHEIEAAVESVEGVVPSFTAAFAVREPGANTDSLAVAFNTPRTSDEELVDLLRRIRMTVLERVGVAPRFLLPVEQAEIPKTGIGKIQRAALTKQFAAGGLDAVVRKSEQLTQRAQTIPNWFFRPIWRKRTAMSYSPVGVGTSLVIVPDGEGIATAIESKARAAGASVTVVSDRAALNAAVADVPAGARLIVLLGDKPADGSAGDVGAQAVSGVASLVAVAQSIAHSRRASAPTELVVFGRNAQSIVPGDPTDVARSSALGILRTIPAEHPEISVRHIDLPPESASALAELVLQEVADRSEEMEVGYRNGERWVPRLSQRPARPSDRGHSFGITPGFYVVTGGLGGLGVEISRQLLRSSDVPLLLIGRRPIADDDERHTTLASLQAIGTVHYEALDVADAGALEASVAAATERWGRPLAGVVHLAGVFEPRLLADETTETLDRALRAKVRGGWSIHQLLLRRPEAVLLAFSSVNGQFGGYSAGAYAAANAFIDSLVQHHVRDLGRAAYSFGWSLWDSIGMSREYALRDSAARRGYRAVSLQQGMVSLTAVAGGEPGHVLIGLDPSNLQVRRSVDDAVVSDGVTTYWTRRDDSASAPASVVRDAFGVAVPCEFREVQATQLAAVRSGGHAMPTADDAMDASFGNDVERAIAKVWRETLSTSRVGPNDNFFDAGGTSLLVAVTSRKLQQLLGRDVPMTDIYRFPTLRLLAAHYGGNVEADAIGLDDSEERGRARRAQRMRRRPRES